MINQMIFRNEDSMILYQMNHYFPPSQIKNHDRRQRLGFQFV